MNGRIVLGAAISALVITMAIAAPVIGRSPGVIHSSEQFAGPSLAHPLGRDYLGRDLWSRIAYGSRNSLTIAAMSVLVAAAVGISVGSLAALLGGSLDFLVLRIIDGLIAFPGLVIALVIRSVLGPGFLSVTLAIAFIYVAIFMRTARNSVLEEQQRPYFDAAIVLGATPISILARHVMRNIAGPLLVLTTVFFADAILAESALSFLGLGRSPLSVSWGSILKDGQPFVGSHPQVVLFPGIVIVVAVLAVNLLADGWQETLEVGSKARVPRRHVPVHNHD